MKTKHFTVQLTSVTGFLALAFLVGSLRNAKELSVCFFGFLMGFTFKTKLIRFN